MVHLFELLISLKKYGIDGNTFVLYHACVDPWSNYNQNFHKIAPLGTILLFSYNLICICSNIYLYKFLSHQTETNTATKEVDKKKERRRNLIPATTGFLFAFSFWEAMKIPLREFQNRTYHFQKLQHIFMALFTV